MSRKKATAFNEHSSKQIAEQTRRLQKTPVNTKLSKKGRREPVSKITRIVKLISQDTDNPQTLVEVQELIIKITRNGSEITQIANMEVGDYVSLVPQGDNFLAVNPRRNLLNDRVYYLAYKHGKHWLIDNQAVFQSWSQTNGLL